jgi:photosystem II reaction center protein PsbP
MHSYRALQPRWKITIIISHMFLPMLRGGWSLLLMMMMIISLTFIPSFLFTTGTIFQTATAQPLSLPSSLESTVKVILSDSIQALKSGNTNKTLQHLNVVDHILATVKENSPSVQTTRLFVSDAIQALRDGDTNKALIHLNLADQQLSTQFPNNKTSSSSQINANTTATPSNNNNNFSTYDNPTLGIRMQYPSNWSPIEYGYNSTTNNTVARFLSPSKIGSELGNVSGVSGNFVPYLDVFVFDSKNMSLDQIVKGRINYFSNNTDFAIHESKPFALNNGNNKQPAYMLDYSATVGGDELFRKMQVYTMFDSKVYVITFTSQQASFINYTPIVQKMINSFIIQNAK